MRERLIELFERIRYVFDDCKIMVGNTIEYVTDYLISEGAIILPCKVGDKVYIIHNTVERIELGLKDCIYETVIDAIHIAGTIEYHMYYKKIVHPDCDFFTEKDIGKTVFFDRKEAEQALKGGVQE